MNRGAPGPIRVLHVDDDPEFAGLTATVLERENDRLAVETAVDAEEGADRLATEAFDCVLSDYDMPGRNGVEFVESTRAEYPDLPCILFTGDDSDGVVTDALSAGATDYVRKRPGSAQYALLANRITNAVEAARSRRLAESSDERLRQVVDALPHLLYVVDEDGTYSLANEALASFHGTTAAELEGTHVSDVLDDPIAREFRADVAAVLESGEPTERSGLPVTDTAGNSRVVVSRLVPYDAAATDDTAVLGVGLDVTERRALEDEHRTEERRYRAIFDDPNNLVGLSDTDGNVIDVNRTAMGYLNAPREEVIGRPVWEASWFARSDAARDDVRRWIDRAAAGEYVPFEIDLASADDPCTVEGVFRPVTDDDGEVVSVLVSGRETTEHHRQRRELEQANALLSTLFDTLPVGVLAEDEARNVLAANQRVSDLFGVCGSADRLVGRDCGELTTEASDLFADPEEFGEEARRLVRENDSVRGEESTLRDGRTFAWSHQPMDLFDGTGRLWTFRDITDRREYEARLEALNETTQELMAAETREAVAEISVEAARDVLDLDANTIYLHDDERSALVPVAHTAAVRDLVGESPVFTAGDSIAWRAYEEGEALALDDVHDDTDILNPDSPVRSELYLPIRTDGLLIAASATPSVFTQQDVVLGEILAGNIAAALEQVEQTERIRARERELTTQNRRLDDFVSIVSHDLRNPLNIAQGRLSLAREDAAERGDDHLDVVARALDRMETLIEDLLTLAREGGQVDDLEPIDVADLFGNCWDTVETATATLTVDGTRSIRAGRSRLRQLFENLIRNAVEHGGENVTVSVGGTDAGFYVEDDGVGIPPERREAVFDAGYSTSRNGTGFGLHIVEQVVDAHGWTVAVTESEGGGTRFEVTGVTTAPSP